MHCPCGRMYVTNPHQKTNPTGYSFACFLEFSFTTSHVCWFHSNGVGGWVSKLGWEHDFDTQDWTIKTISLQEIIANVAQQLYMCLSSQAFYSSNLRWTEAHEVLDRITIHLSGVRLHFKIVRDISLTPQLFQLPASRLAPLFAVRWLPPSYGLRIGITWARCTK